MTRELKFDVIVNMPKFSCQEHKTLEEAIASDYVLVRGNALVPSRDVTIRQYTGLKDKDGAEGYDGDITKLGNTLWHILWDNEYACWQMKRIKGTHLMPSIPLHNLAKSEIVGNIHENRELLKA